MSKLNIKLEPVLPSEWTEIARIEALAFGDEEFSQVAFGAQRFEERVLVARGMEMGMFREGVVQRDIKAVVVGEDGSKKIVGFAGWQSVFLDGKGWDSGVGIYGAGLGKADDSKKEDETKDKEKVKTSINEKLCDDLFIPGDQHMARACDGGDYHKLFVLVIHPDYQRKGIGGLLLADGLKVADEKRLQCVLGASPEGVGLYKKYGFLVVAEMRLELSKYEGGEGFGIVEHAIMHRSAREV